MKKLLVLIAVSLLASAAYAAEKDKQAPGKGVSFVEPRNGAVVGGEFKVVMGVKGMEVKPAGDMTANTGHHHLLVDSKPVEKGKVVPTDDKHLHFGKGQTETTLKLPPGKHTLMLQFADGSHQSYGPEMRRSITVSVK